MSMPTRSHRHVTTFRRLASALLAALGSAILLVPTARAQTMPRPAQPSTAPRSTRPAPQPQRADTVEVGDPDNPMAGMAEGMDMGVSMLPMMQRMSAGMLQGLLAELSRPETARQMATFTKNYFDALVARGFTRDEALRIVMAQGLPATPGLR